MSCSTVLLLLISRASCTHPALPCTALLSVPGPPTILLDSSASSDSTQEQRARGLPALIGLMSSACNTVACSILQSAGPESTTAQEARCCRSYRVLLLLDTPQPAAVSTKAWSLSEQPDLEADDRNLRQKQQHQKHTSSQTVCQAQQVTSITWVSAQDATAPPPCDLQSLR
jgi:hypothetical protein